MTIASYDAIAEWYHESIVKNALLSEDDMVADLFASIGNLDTISVCDLACGQGVIARKMAQHGAKVVGVDISQKLLDFAQGEEDAHPQGIVYVRDDAQVLSSLENAVFDGVLCNMALMDIPNLRATFCAVRRILRPNGWYAFTITHPCFQGPPDQSYYDEGFWRSNNLQGVRGQVGVHHRTLSTYLNALTEAGLFVERVSEPRIPGRDAPVVLAALCRTSTVWKAL